MSKKLLLIIVLLLTGAIITLGTLKVSKFSEDNPPLSLARWALPALNEGRGPELCLGMGYALKASGWPMPYNYVDEEQPGCAGGFYPLIFIVDALFFTALLAVAWLGIAKFKKPKARSR